MALALRRHRVERVRQTFARWKRPRPATSPSATLMSPTRFSELVRPISCSAMASGSHMEWFWEIPSTAQFLIHLSSFSRVIVFDRRGMGASNGVPHNAIPTWEQWAEDMGAELDAAESKQAAIVAAMDTGPLAILFAAMHSERAATSFS